MLNESTTWDVFGVNCILYLYYAVVVQVPIPIIPFKNPEIFFLITARWLQDHPNIGILICLSLKDDSDLWFCSQSGINTSLGGGSVIFVYSHITWPSKTLVGFQVAVTTQMCNQYRTNHMHVFFDSCQGGSVVVLGPQLQCSDAQNQRSYPASWADSWILERESTPWSTAWPNVRFLQWLVVLRGE